MNTLSEKTENGLMKIKIKTHNWILLFAFTIILPLGLYSQNETIKNEILKNGAIIRKAFADGDIEKIESLHHPDVIKALGFNDLKTGRDEVIKGLRATLEHFSLEFLKNEVENILIQDNIAIEQTIFSIRGIPKHGGSPFIFNGRTMVTYIKYDKSPTGWATIREIIQPATE